MARSQKAPIIESIFLKRWDANTGSLSSTIVTLEEVGAAIRAHPEITLSDRNPANFFKDIPRNRRSANDNWPRSLLERYTARQRTGSGDCFEFVKMAPGQTEPFPNSLPEPTEATQRLAIESVSMPLASRRLGRTDESWLIQVVVRLRVMESHLALVSQRRIQQLDHLQTSVKLGSSEVDALFLAIESQETGPREIIVSCEAKGLKDDILLDQVLAQVKKLFHQSRITQDVILPVAVKAIARSRIHVFEFDVISREQGLRALRYWLPRGEQLPELAWGRAEIA